MPGAKLLPMTTNGPDAPLIEIPTGPSRIAACPLAGLRAEIRRSSSGRRFWVGAPPRAGADGTRFAFLDLELVAGAER